MWMTTVQCPERTGDSLRTQHDGDWQAFVSGALWALLRVSQGPEDMRMSLSWVRIPSGPARLQASVSLSLQVSLPPAEPWQ